MLPRRKRREARQGIERKRTLRPSADEEQEFAADLVRDSRGRTASSMASLVAEDGTPTGAPEVEPFVPDPEPHRQHARKGQAESPAELTPNRPEKKRRRRSGPPPAAQ
jgi:hypothetical protein